MNKFYILLCAALLLWSCAGVFATDDKLYNTYSSSVSDNNITVFYTFSPEVMNIAVKNTGNAFINNLSISFVCTEIGKSNTLMYSLGNLKPYFNKAFTVPFAVGRCNTIVAEYYFTPSKDGEFIDNNNINGNFEHIPSNPIHGTLTIK